MKHPIFYLACPYTHPAGHRIVENARAREATLAAARLTALGLPVMSPLTHGHPICEAGHLRKLASNGTWEAWEQIDLAMLEACDAVIVLRLEGWAQSKGIAAELSKAKALGMPVYFLPHPGDADWNEEWAALLKEIRLDVGEGA